MLNGNSEASMVDDSRGQVDDIREDNWFYDCSKYSTVDDSILESSSNYGNVDDSSKYHMGDYSRKDNILDNSSHTASWRQRI